MVLVMARMFLFRFAHSTKVLAMAQMFLFRFAHPTKVLVMAMYLFRFAHPTKVLAMNHMFPFAPCIPAILIAIDHHHHRQPRLPLASSFRLKFLSNLS